MMLHSTKSKLLRGMYSALAVAGLLILAGCAANQPYGNRNGGGYGTTYGQSQGYGSSRACNQCGTVQSVREVYVNDQNSSHILGTVIGAVVGGALGNQVGKGDGRKAATVAGAVAGGAVGHHVAEKNAHGKVAYRVVVRLDDGRTATVTQRQNPGVRRGDRVNVSNGHVYSR